MSIILFATELYGLPILRPVAAAAAARGIEVAWVVNDAIADKLQPNEKRLTTLTDARRWQAESVFCASNWVLPAIPGNKIEVFHGFSTDKRSRERGHFRIRGFFDLYCTQGPDTTAPFAALARKHKHFAVQETGWSKLDPLFAPPEAHVRQLQSRAAGRPCVMYAATFTPALSAAPDMLAPLRQWIARGDRFWLLTLHPKCSAELYAAYRALAQEYPQHATFLGTQHLLTMMRTADVLVCDTSSVIDEFAVQLKPVVTVRNRIPKPFMLNVTEPEAVDVAIDKALRQPDDLMHQIRLHADNIHPYRDGHSSQRLLDAAAALARGDFGRLPRKPLNLIRRWKTRKYKDILR